jgi:hypothetical protein
MSRDGSLYRRAGPQRRAKNIVFKAQKKVC